MTSIRWLGSYIFMAAMAIAVAFFFASALMPRGQAQSEGQTPPPGVPTQAPPMGTPAGTVPDALLEGNIPPMQQTNIPPSNPDDFILDAAGMRDPFKPYKAFKAEKTGPQESTDPLQNLDLTTVELVAVIWDVQAPKALIRTRSGTLYTIKRNTKLGRNNGFVAGIREGEVIVLESFEEEGRIHKEYTSIKMQSKNAKTLGQN